MQSNIPAQRLVTHRFDAVVLDLDGVITRTAKMHAAACKAMFDDYLEAHAAGRAWTAFDIEHDYRVHVDAKPRYAGVQSFLASRDIVLPHGEPGDPPERETICGLGNRKHRRFLVMLQRDGTEVYTSTIAFICAMREIDKRTAVVSSSRSCRAVLEAAGIAELFDERVDGTDLQRLDLNPKPAPDMFLEACRRLGSDPARSIGVEDTDAGVQAAKAAGLGCIIGVDRGRRAQELFAQGADMVVEDLAHLHLMGEPADRRSITPLPSALDCLERIIPRGAQEAALFLDYDGTLTPIVSHPDDAVLSRSMRTVLQRLTGLCEFAVISGRDLADVRQRVGLEAIWYAGSHGYDIAGPEGERSRYQEGADFLPLLKEAEQAVRHCLGGMDGCLVERKRFSIAIHTRQVTAADLADVARRVEQIHADHPGLRLSRGKQLFELQPALDWDKGKALRWLMQTLDMDPARFVPIYLGDDVTDEDAFRELAEDGVGILVSATDQPTHAAYRLADPAAVETFLERLGDSLERSG